MDGSINNRNNKSTRFNVARAININCIIYKFILKYVFKTYFYDNISIKSNVFQKNTKIYYGKLLLQELKRKYNKKKQKI